MSKPHTHKPPYSVAFRQQMVELVESGRNPNELAREFSCHVTSILSWVRKAKSAAPAQTQCATAANNLNPNERQELIELRRKVRQLQIERDILSKATAWFANKNEPTCTTSTR